MEPSERQLGDFRLVREVGRGGMGVVYEAEQISLHRRVALKVLPFAAALDLRQIQRFQLEAQAAACLHHPNIVPVHGVGCERGVYYYAMQLIDGQSLAETIAELRRLDGLDPGDAPAPDLAAISTTALAARLLTGVAADRPAGAGSDTPTVVEGPASAPREIGGPAIPPPDRGPATGSSTRNRTYVRAAARLALQAAEALDHAHARGVLHRDIKPGNLLLDAAGGLWVTDFGLAQIRGDDRLTRSGDVLGTLRYMSPEQALGRRVVIDGRTDVYSLGVTLYELLTLRPAVDGPDRAEILRHVAEQEPVPPRRLNPSVPIDLETIVLKASAKDPSARYATAGEMADDMRRFLEDQPIRARRPSLLDRAAKWSRRYVAAVASAFVLLLLSVAGLAVGTLLIARERDRAVAAEGQAEAAAEQARSEVAIAQAVSNFLQQDLLAQADPMNEPDRDLKLRTVLDRASRSIGGRFDRQPLVEAAIRRTIATTYKSLFLPEEAQPHLERALELLRRVRGEEHPETMAALGELGDALRQQAQVRRG